MWKGKKIFLKLKEGAIYSNALVLDADNDFLKIKARDGQIVLLAISEIKKISEEGNWRWGNGKNRK